MLSRTWGGGTLLQVAGVHPNPARGRHGREPPAPNGTPLGGGVGGAKNWKRPPLGDPSQFMSFFF
jgi:hypothetical protein